MAVIETGLSETAPARKAAEEEREKIVLWLRQCAKFAASGEAMDTFDFAADAIERKEHLG